MARSLPGQDGWGSGAPFLPLADREAPGPAVLNLCQLGRLLPEDLAYQDRWF
jgi:hypothetical protein